MPSDAISCYAFGAPPVLSLAESSAARNVMEVKRPSESVAFLDFSAVPAKSGQSIMQSKIA
jgi:hypothetical protein